MIPSISGHAQFKLDSLSAVFSPGSEKLSGTGNIQSGIHQKAEKRNANGRFSCKKNFEILFIVSNLAKRYIDKYVN